MDSDSSLRELYTTVNGPLYEDFCANDNTLTESQCLHDKNKTSTAYQTISSVPNPSINDVMNYIRQTLLEENTDEEIIACQEGSAIKATEKLFFDILRQDYSSSQNQQTPNTRDDGTYKQFDDSSSTSGSVGTGFTCTNDDGFMASQMQKGIEEAMKFLPNIDKLLFKNKLDYKDDDVTVIEERASKQIAVTSDEFIRNETYEKVLHVQGQEYIEEVIALRKLRIKDKNEISESSKAMIKKQPEKGLIGDLRPLLMLCCQAVSVNDHQRANDLIKQIREHSSPKGDWSERLAHYFVIGLEARLAGTGSELYHKHFLNQAMTVEFLAVYRMLLAFCPYDRVSSFFSDQTILNVSKNASKVHIIDFSIQFGFHWLSLFERFSSQETKPPHIKITGVDNPLPGFRPAKRVEETGRRLANYAQSFNITFEYNGILSKLADFCVDDLNIKKDEVIIIYMSTTLKFGGETSAVDKDCHRDKFLKNIRKIKPDLLIHGVENSSYDTPFFDTRFKEALFHYSSLFDMLDSIMPRDKEERFLLESHWLGPGAINAIACEGSDRVERPETYRKWHTRNTRAGFVPLPIDQVVMKKMKKLVRELYHNEFVVDEDNNWVVFGWKGRILFAVSTWKCNDI